MTLGDKVEWDNGRTGRTIKGTCTGIKRGTGTIRNLDSSEEWPTARFRIKPSDGGRAVWTDAFPDKDGEYADLRPGEVKE